MHWFGVLLLGVVSFATILVAAPVEETGRADIVRYENVQTENGYRFSYETVDGQIREEVAVLDAESGVLRVSGWYSFRTPDGATHRVDFVADENGYRTTEQPNIAGQVHTQALSNTALLSLVG